MTADLDALTREALDSWDSPNMLITKEQFDLLGSAIAHAIRFTLSRYAPHELPDPVKELAERLKKEWESGDLPGSDYTQYIIRRTREEDAKVAK